jgi:hypothetical protein
MFGIIGLVWIAFNVVFAVVAMRPSFKRLLRRKN